MNSSSAWRLMVAAAAVLCAVFPLRVRAGAIQCPSQITVHEQADASQLTVWQFFNGNAHDVHHFYGVAFSEGVPADLVYFNPRKVATKSGKVEIYDFGPQIKGDLWISCLYRETSQIVAQRIDPKPLKCKVIYDNKRVDAVKSVNCD